jgi:hypothetical protein
VILEKEKTDAVKREEVSNSSPWCLLTENECGTQQVEWAVGSTSLQPMTGSMTADRKVLDHGQRISMVEAGLRHTARTADLDCFGRVVEGAAQCMARYGHHGPAWSISVDEEKGSTGHNGRVAVMGVPPQQSQHWPMKWAKEYLGLGCAGIASHSLAIINRPPLGLRDENLSSSSANGEIHAYLLGRLLAMACNCLVNHFMYRLHALFQIEACISCLTTLGALMVH